MRASLVVVAAVTAALLTGCNPDAGETFARDMSHAGGVSITKADGNTILNEARNFRDPISTSDLLAELHERGSEAKSDLLEVGESLGCAAVDQWNETGTWPGDQVAQTLEGDISAQQGITPQLLEAICKADQLAKSGL